MSLSPAFLDELRSRTLLSALIGKSVKLQRAGREFRACCPFHNEKSPSFYVNDEKGFYHCFGCGAHGDAIRWMTDNQGLPFIDAVKELAAAAGLDMPAPDPRAAERNERQAGLHEVMTEAARWFQEQLAGIAGTDARAYLDRRGVDEAARRAFGLGFAPASGGKLKAALARAGEEKLIEAGLLISPKEHGSDKEPYDRFRGRLMIPIRDPRGRVIAFGGRVIGPGEPKYLNSPDTPLFDKGRTLFNLDRAAPATRRANRLIVVEGYMDVIALARAGIDEAVAPLGTALTEAQLERMWRLVEVPLLCFDGDSAGQKAAIRAALRALPLLAPSRSLRFVTLPSGQDPDDLVRSGGAGAVEALLTNAEPLVDRLWNHEFAAQPLDTPEARAGLRRRLSEHARAIGDADVREQYLGEFNRRFDDLFGRRQSRPQPRYERRTPQGRNRRGFDQPAFARPASAEARAIGASGIDRLLLRAVFAGLIRYPDVAAARIETLTGLVLADRPLARLRDSLVSAIYSGDAVDSASIESILSSTGLGDVVVELRRTNALAFSFLRSDADSGRARTDLAAAIEALAARPELDAALAAATERLARADAEDAEEAAREQLRLSRARQKAERLLMALAGGEGSAGPESA